MEEMKVPTILMQKIVNYLMECKAGQVLDLLNEIKVWNDKLKSEKEAQEQA